MDAGAAADLEQGTLTGAEDVAEGVGDSDRIAVRVEVSWKELMLVPVGDVVVRRPTVWIPSRSGPPLMFGFVFCGHHGRGTEFSGGCVVESVPSRPWPWPPALPVAATAPSRQSRQSGPDSAHDLAGTGHCVGRLSVGRHADQKARCRGPSRCGGTSLSAQRAA